mmetsp:Transcript_29755/g.28619  ORF Transcript_29755/g.28619 Transcript_29755/m.28619 type:complete len:225 (-) Transcript_29755:294-968(-)|eukprot:CAMPEP_0197834360 /NCGR_PEP_ID=MMETSP1437-20131217/22089_1 /TAXON_ID=49252 ORGANISM="Eucampia antarctica, Strain CCMP1452" /NCGR_SAMPLE_ID=MMETSP1437 /ASSEMBLY_ACC=CAM_ASM_001096 /LENGTH=224 /DNA_ID=CAMNT_0043438965 /DNA_START=214 /DNA_END=888 /DNA_ORIENTATION=+
MATIMRTQQMSVWAVFFCLFLLKDTTAFVVFSSAPRSSVCVFSESVTSSPVVEGTAESGDADDEEEEWEYEEFENLEQQDFFNSEWKLGTCYDDRPDKVQETWCRLIVDENGDNVCVWGDGANGKWKFDLASQFLQLSKESFGGWGGKKLWAGVVDDYYYLRGTVRGWGPLQSANVMAQWQAKRLGVDPKEAGEAPWFQNESQSGEDEQKELPGGEESSIMETL